MSELSLEDLNGDQILLDYSPTLRWCDGSVKWEYIIFMANYTSPKKECYQRLLWYFPVQAERPFKFLFPPIKYQVQAGTIQPASERITMGKAKSSGAELNFP